MTKFTNQPPAASRQQTPATNQQHSIYPERKKMENDRLILIDPSVISDTSATTVTIVTKGPKNSP
jgi:hypothetical protein